MKMKNIKKTISIVFKQGVDRTKFIIAFLILCTLFSFNVLAQTTPLDEDSAAALVEQLTSGLQTEIENEDNITAILEKWESRDLVGKTRKQAIDILFADVKSIVKDPEVLKKTRGYVEFQQRGTSAGCDT